MGCPHAAAEAAEATTAAPPPLCDDNGVASFDRIRHRRHDGDAFLYAFDLIELNGTWTPTRFNLPGTPYVAKARLSQCPLRSESDRSAALPRRAHRAAHRFTAMA